MAEEHSVLVVEDDSALASMLKELLEGEGYDVVVAADGQRALHQGLTRDFDVMVMDRGLPGLEGLEVLERLRRKGISTPALVLSALGNPADRVEGLDRGAEDYMGKPFDLDELLARIRSLIRRHADTSAMLRIPGGVLDVGSRTATVDGTGRVVLSERECDFLEHLARRPQQVFTRAGLLESIFSDADEGGVVDTYVHYLRKKLGRSCIRTVRGLGYVLGPPG
ncbi:DNA-binding response regulator [Arthrobacter sp. AQ5-05]|uniref:response regulator transcription factor n=1 Tax=Arthrobacter sp. AQ5-05 TaxID=2184581 RepID=UPI000DCBFB3B|nr:response regulator transcription factor [Arthrobacter sp. AQ5-05]RAX48662.1 DNA-binding response regulator [Arthrobacter sp. AQ5-05]